MHYPEARSLQRAFIFPSPNVNFLRLYSVVFSALVDVGYLHSAFGAGFESTTAHHLATKRKNYAPDAALRGMLRAVPSPNEMSVKD